MSYFLRTTDALGRSHGGFQWPLEVGAVVSAPDWSPKPVCGRGLHGLHNGPGVPRGLVFAATLALTSFGILLAWWLA